MSNEKMLDARKNKDNEFYTLYKDIDSFLKFYGESGFLKNKVIHLPCDSIESNFYKYLKDNFNNFEIKEVVATEYDPTGGSIARFSKTGESIEKVKESLSYLEKESQDISIGSDVIITNPPFTNVSEYMRFLLKHKKDFIVLAGLSKISNIDFLPISESIGEDYYYYKYSLNFSRPDNSIKNIPVMWVTNVKNSYKKIKKVSDMKPKVSYKKTFEEVINMETPDGDRIFSISNVYMLNHLPKGTKYILTPITIAIYDHNEHFEIIGFAGHKGFEDWYIPDTDLKKAPFIKDKNGEFKELYKRAIVRVK